MGEKIISFIKAQILLYASISSSLVADRKRNSPGRKPESGRTLKGQLGKDQRQTRPPGRWALLSSKGLPRGIMKLAYTIISRILN